MKLLMLKGLPGSGKSTWAKNYVENNSGWIRINKDSIRDMMVYRRNDESLVLKFRDTLIIHALATQKSVIVDDTNFHPKHEQRLREIAALYGADFDIEVFATKLQDCIKNDLRRPNSVGEKVIRQMHQQYVRPHFYGQYRPNEKLPKAVICDLDGTLALLNGRNPYDASTCDEDLVNRPVAEIIWKYGRDDYQILFTSGREEKYRAQTMKFLARAGMPCYQLFMRATGDSRKDDLVKYELFNDHIRENYNVEVVFDDRQRVVDMWRDIGLTVFQVADGNF